MAAPGERPSLEEPLLHHFDRLDMVHLGEAALGHLEDAARIVHDHRDEERLQTEGDVLHLHAADRDALREDGPDPLRDLVEVGLHALGHQPEQHRDLAHRTWPPTAPRTRTSRTGRGRSGPGSGRSGRSWSRRSSGTGTGSPPWPAPSVRTRNNAARSVPPSCFPPGSFGGQRRVVPRRRAATRDTNIKMAPKNATIPATYHRV